MIKTLPELEEEYLKVITEINKLELRKSMIRDALLELANGKDLLGEKLMVKFQKRKGNIQYKNIPEVQELSSDYLDHFRGDSKVIPVIKVF